MRKITLTILATIIIVSLGKSQTLNVPDNIGTSTNAGNVGIGTTDPQVKLHIDDVTPNTELLRLDNDGLRYTSLINYSDGTYDNAGLQFKKWSTVGQFKFSNNNGDLMTILSNGKVGIGTSTLNSKFNVVGQDIEFYSNTSENTLRFGRNVNESFILYVTDSNGFLDYNQDSDNDGGHVFYIRNVASGTSTDNDIRFQTSGLTRLTIKANGNVGIGTISPGYKLDVIGTIRAQEIKVDMDGADFVFENNYKLRSLEEIESFIKENRHLPDIEPASEMEKNETELGEFNSKLLQKIEELTLYMIEQNKETKKLIEKVETLEFENKELKEKILKIEASE